MALCPNRCTSHSSPDYTHHCCIAVAPCFSLTKATKSSIAPGQAASELHQSMDSSSMVLRIKTSVCSHRSLLIGRLCLVSINSIHHFSHGTDLVSHATPPFSEVKKSCHCSTASSMLTLRWPCIRHSKKV